MKPLCSIALAAFLMTSSGLKAQSADGDQTKPRYSMIQTENGFVRLDGKSGDLSICTQRDGKLTCRLAADERQAYQTAIDELSTRVSKLEERLAKIDEVPSTGKSSKPKSRVPGEAELDKALNLAEKAMRRFFHMVEELKKEFDSGKT